MISTSDGKKIENYYDSIGDTANKDAQSYSNRSVSAIHPFAELNHNIKNIQYRAKFFQDEKNELYVTLEELFQGRVKNPIHLRESEIYHTGFVYSTSVSNMTKTEKERFISLISSMKIYDINIKNRYIMIW